jgi:hypothetical protein
VSTTPVAFWALVIYSSVLLICASEALVEFLNAVASLFWLASSSIAAFTASLPILIAAAPAAAPNAANAKAAFLTDELSFWLKVLLDFQQNLTP